MRDLHSGDGRGIRISWVLRALWELLTFETVSALWGYRAIKRFACCSIPTLSGEKVDPDLIKRAVELACSIYPKKTLCLQRSVALSRLLRSSGWSAEVVTGVQQLPFRSHAWVELKGIPFGEAHRIAELFRPIDRWGTPFLEHQ